jgi:RNA polymerase-binding transcription factor DksA
VEAGIRGRIWGARDGTPREVVDAVEMSDGDVQSDIEFAVFEMRVQSLAQIDAALARLAAGHYGNCTACRGEIATRRLSVVPFATRCLACEALREAGATRMRREAGPMTLDTDEDQYAAGRGTLGRGA